MCVLPIDPQCGWHGRRRHVVGRLGALALLHGTGLKAAQHEVYPQRAVHLIVPLGAGSSLDVRARALAGRLADRLGQPVLVENRTGAGSTLGTASVAEARADGYTVLCTLSPNLQTGPLLYRSARYDAITSFTPIGTVSRSAPFLVVNAALPIRTVKALIERARATPRGLPIAYSGRGGAMHLPSEMLRQAAGVDFLFVPYQSEADSLQDLLGGRIMAAHYYGGLAVPLVQSGRLRALAFAGPQRNVSLPDVPTYAEAGYPGVIFQVVVLLLGPAGLPPPIVERLSEALRDATLDAGLQLQFEKTGAQLAFGTPEQAAATIREDAVRAGRLMAQLRLRPE